MLSDPKICFRVCFGHIFANVAQICTKKGLRIKENDLLFTSYTLNKASALLSYLLFLLDIFSFC